MNQSKNVSITFPDLSFFLLINPFCQVSWSRVLQGGGGRDRESAGEGGRGMAHESWGLPLVGSGGSEGPGDVGCTRAQAYPQKLPVNPASRASK
jgi:hypothetical protein